MAAAVGDSVIMLIAFVAVALLARSQDWVRAPRRSKVAAFIFIGLVVTTVLEVIATPSDGRFSGRYMSTMLVTPVLGVGLIPMLMWLIVSLLVLWFVRRQMGQR